MTLLLLAAAGAAGALARWAVGHAVQTRVGDRLPWGTLVVNALGSWLLGLLAGLAAAGRLPGSALLVLGTGFCGAFTTFSTLAVESARLESGPVRSAGLLFAGTASSAAAAAFGLLLARLAGA